MTKAKDNEAFVEAVQKWLGVEVDGWGGVETMTAFMAKTGEPSVNVASGSIPDDYWPMLSKIESGDRPYAKAETSSASGLFQFIKKTWIGEGGKWGDYPGVAFGGLMPSPAEQLERAKTFTEKNADVLRRAGLPINKASLYAAHFLGAGTAVDALKGDVREPVSNHVDAAAIKANRSILGDGKTVGDFLSWLNRKTGVWAK